MPCKLDCTQCPHPWCFEEYPTEHTVRYVYSAPPVVTAVPSVNLRDLIVVVEKT